MNRFLVGILAASAILAPDRFNYQQQQAPARATITGTVTDSATGTALGLANVMLAGTSYGAATDAQGKYTITQVPAGVYTIRATRVGYAPSTRPNVKITAGSPNEVNLAMNVQVLTLSSVVSTGLTDPASGSRAAFSIATVSGEKLTVPPYGSPLEALAGKVAGLTIIGRNPYSIAFVPPSQERQALCPQGNCNHNTESYTGIVDNPFLASAHNPLSTFSIDVDRASYSNIRRFITQGQLPPKDAVRIEELVNYFHYDLPSPRPNSQHPFLVTTEVAVAPWKRSHRLVRVGLQGVRLETATLPPSNLVFLIDVSGSMQVENKLPLVKQSLRLLVDQLREQDRVAMVVYAGSAGLVLESTSGAEKTRIIAAIERLQAGGSTAGGAGIRLAYNVARQNQIAGGNNRVILATDGDFNVGVSSDAEMGRLVEDERQHGTFLTVLGYGMGNYKDSKLETLADKGNGNYAYIDDIMEARKVLVSEMGGTLYTIAKDVKLQVEFNPNRVHAYRLIGYENRALRSEDFADDKKDAGEMGAGHSVTALYEIVMVGAETDVTVRSIDTLRYQRSPAERSSAYANELMLVKLRYKKPDESRSLLFTHTVQDRLTPPSTDFNFTAAVAAFGMILRDSEHKGRATVEDVIAMASGDRPHSAVTERVIAATSWIWCALTSVWLTLRAVCSGEIDGSSQPLAVIHISRR